MLPPTAQLCFRDGGSERTKNHFSVQVELNDTFPIFALKPVRVMVAIDGSGNGLQMNSRDL